MTTTVHHRRSRRLPTGAALLCLLGAACAGARAAGPSVTGHEPTPRRPDGVFLDVAPAHQRPVARAPAGGVAVLLAPPAREEALSVLRSYLRAFVTSDAALFGAVVAHGARRMEEDAGADLEQRLVQRVRATDYTRIPVDSIVALPEVRFFDREAAPDDVRAMTPLRDDEVVLDIPVRLERAGNVRLFGPRIVLVLRRSDESGVLQVVAAGESDAPWP